MVDTSEPIPKIFSVRIVSMDYYMAPPVHGLDISYSSFQGGKVNEVPVIRIYGSTPAGQKTCLHVHGALPYLYVPCLDLSLQPEQEGSAFTNAMSLAIEKALKLKGSAGSKRQHVHGCSLVRAKRFYGYHSLEELFLKIYLYHPQDVSRASRLLLAGAILDKILQPHESHIPYLLQFLVDYNLYGMGHLHVSKLKFRHPVPAVSCSRKATCTFSQMEPKDLSNSMDASTPADAGDSCLALPVWTSSTIPDGWTWQTHSQPDSTVDHNLLLVKRQSTSELEGDAVVEDILNQLFMSFTSLSQTQSEVKMVQSLIPIWEEFERSGIQGPAAPPDPGKPLAEDVLKTLSHWLEREKMIAKLSDVVGNSSSSQQYIRSLTDEGNLIQCGNSEDKAKEVLRSSEGNDAVGSLSSGNLFNAHNEDGERTSEEQNDHANQLSVDQFQKSHSVGSANMKAPDQDALGLLKWIASSQAAEEINSDDELAHQTILNPLLPASTIDEVLEKANADIENESQQECQDILDSIEDLVTSEESSGKANCENYNLASRTLFDERNLQLDNSSVNFNAVPFGDKSSSEVKCDSETSQDAGLNHFGCKRKKREWGCLPLSSNQRSDSISVPDTFDVISAHRGGTKVSVETSFHEKNEADKFPNFLKGDANISDAYQEEPSVLVGCSMRDLMRKKRCYRIELSESKTPQVREVLSKEKQKEETFFCREQGYDKQSRSSHVSSVYYPSVIEKLENNCLWPAWEEAGEDFDKKFDKSNCSLHGKSPLSSGNANMLLANVSKDGQLCSSKQLDAHTSHGGIAASHGTSGSSNLLGELRNDCKVIDATGSSRQCSTRIGGENFEINVGVFNSGSKSKNSLEVPQMPSENLKDTGMSSTGEALMKPYTQAVRQQEEETRLPEICSSTASLRADHLELRGLTLCQKPPVIECTYEHGENSALSPSMALEPPAVKGKDEEIAFHIGDLDDILPFFMKDNLEEKEPQNVSRIAEYSNHQEAIIGVPVHYQNDGSFLYMLTPIQSPPLEEHVKRWLSFDGKNTTCDCTAEPTALTKPPRQFPGDLMESQAPLCPASDLHLLDPGSRPKSKPNLDGSNLRNQENHGEEVESHNDEVRAIQKDECKTLASKPSTVLSQEISQLSGPDVKSKLTPLSQMGFRDPASVAGRQQLTTVSIEIHAGCRGDLRPDPRFDAINIITLVIQEDDDATADAFMLLLSSTGKNGQNLDGISDCKVLVFDEEEQLFSHFMKIISVVDPDILMGWDIQAGSLGFLAERAAYLGIGLLSNISRTPLQSSVASGGPNNIEKAVPDDMFIKANTSDSVNLQDAIIEDEWGRTHASGVHVGGRIVLNIWRLMRGELKLNMYTLEAVAEAVLRKKVPYIPHNVLAKWFSSGPGHARYRCMEYVLGKAKLNLQIMNQHDMINRTSELARVFGIDFFSVLSRGSQYRVESMFLRLAHTQNYVAISPGNLQVAYQPAMDCLPLVMEPESGFYADPVIILDFQSLYPSMIIAYNLCFCTCLGKIMPSVANILGVSSYSPDINVLQSLKHEFLLTPNGVMYVPSKVCKGVLPRLLEEILSTRIMVKQAMKKLAPSQLVLQRIFNARQLALKLIANVTYGYTAAGFSGRMPCAELADSIVQCARRTLENAISFVNNHDKWKAKVIYGDTDSLFVLLKGRSLKDAFQIGDEIASAISAMNPKPVVLKMEKVYYPCFLLTKKRYVGYSYESPDQTKPKFDAKGIETVRRDSCGAVSKTMEQSLRIYFEHQDIDKVKKYLLRQWTRIISGRVSLEDFVFAKEVCLGTYRVGPSSLPPAAIVATKAMRADPRAEPCYAERVPYVVVHGEPGARLVDMVVDPMELLAIDSPYRLNEVYYIRKQIIPALQRVFGLVGADLNQWFSNMPRPERESVGKRQLFASCNNRTRIDSYYLSKHCVLCDALVQANTHLCLKCSRSEATVAIALTGRTAKLEKDIQHLVAMCRHCGGGDWLIESGVKCTSLACSVFYERRKTQKELKSLSTVATEAGLYPKCLVEWF